MKPLGLFLIVLLLLFSGSVEAQRKSSKGALRTDLSKVRKDKKAAQAKLRETRKRVNVVIGDIDEVDKRLGTVEQELEQTTTKLEQSRVEQAKVGKELQEATKLLDAKKAQLRKRLRQMYIQGEGSLIATLVDSRSVGELADRRYLFDRIATKDRQLFDEVKRLKAEVSAKKKRTDQLVADIAGLANRQQSQQDSLEATREEKADVLDDLKTQQQKLEQIVQQLDQEENNIEAQIAAYNRKVASGGAVRLPAFTGRFSKPVNAPAGSGFGMRFHPILKINRMHKGVDFRAKYGQPIYASAGGVVISAGYGRGYGNHVIIDHGGGISTLYAHCSRMSVHGGQRVNRGQVIGAVGATGLATGPHLHFEVRVNGRAVNPLGRL